MNKFNSCYLQSIHKGTLWGLYTGKTFSKKVQYIENEIKDFISDSDGNVLSHTLICRT